MTWWSALTASLTEAQCACANSASCGVVRASHDRVEERRVFAISALPQHLLLVNVHGVAVAKPVGARKVGTRERHNVEAAAVVGELHDAPDGVKLVRHICIVVPVLELALAPAVANGRRDNGELREPVVGHLERDAHVRHAEGPALARRPRLDRQHARLVARHLAAVHRVLLAPELPPVPVRLDPRRVLSEAGAARLARRVAARLGEDGGEHLLDERFRCRRHERRRLGRVAVGEAHLVAEGQHPALDAGGVGELARLYGERLLESFSNFNIKI
ncbi:hypothetical protein BN1723_004971 [Verticillium longisporum]|uniref:Uncharacterized protein n=1 Tax=Verticillium longisporum TaxID=100787 RepID=A0A0G4N3I4_VERLO|nr:hypothetical protein BN1723_004971 [Verticillium longisporum]